MKILDIRPALIAVTLLMFVACSGSSRNTAVSKLSEAIGNNNSSSVKGPIRGDKSSKIYHWQGCPEYDRIAAEHVVEFPNAAAAEAAGYRAALNCPKEAGSESTARTQPAQPPSSQPRATEPPIMQPRTTPPPSTQPAPTPRSEATPANKPSNLNKPDSKNMNTTAEAKVSHPRVKVWVNTDSGIYECPGAALYGKTKKGEYMTQAAALKKGLRPAGNNMCQ